MDDITIPDAAQVAAYHQWRRIDPIIGTGDVRLIIAAAAPHIAAQALPVDDLSRLLRDLNGKAIGHEVSYATDLVDDRSAYAVVTAQNEDGTVWMAADFGCRGTRWDLLRGYYRGRHETIEGLLKIIEEA